jgi:hypothetical protein
MVVDFGKTASDYARYRAGFPERFYDRIFNDGWIILEERARRAKKAMPDWALVQLCGVFSIPPLEISAAV